tara:strand:+ start:421 stop:606 length:186 start_codon:yes stop_codon:yes gene_type:complete
MKNSVKYMSVSEIRIAYNYLSAIKPEIVNDAQAFTESLVPMSRASLKAFRFNEVRLAMRNL